MKVEWLIFALMGTVFFSAAGVLDKFLLRDYAKDSRAYIVCQILAQQLFTVPVILMVGADFTYPQSLLALIFGGFQVFPSLFYMRAMQIEETSKVIALEHLYLVFVFMGSAFLLGEILEPKHYAGGFMLLLGALLISHGKGCALTKGPGGLLSLSPAIKPFLPYWILTAGYYIFLKYLLISLDGWHLYAWSSLGSLVAIMPLMSIQTTRHEVRNFFCRGGVAIGALISEETFQFLGIIFSFFAYALGSVTLVSSIASLQPVLALLLILALGIFVPRLAKRMEERTDRRSLMLKSLSFLIMLTGIYFVS
jgi:uncharacterized membrane protein